MKISDSDAARFWDRVSKSDDCWIWGGTLTSSDYGRMRVGGKYIRAHRIAYFLSHGEDAEGDVLHTCDNRLCCNPEHLYSGDQAQNMEDARMRRRFSATLTESDVRLIRDLYIPRDPVFGAKGLSKHFGVDPSSISSIITGRTWGYVQD